MWTLRRRSRRNVRYYALLTVLVFSFWLYARSRSEHPSIPHTTRQLRYARPVQTKSQPPPLVKLKYRPDGLVEVNPDGPHPIYDLIARAEKAWSEKHKRASKTLEQAVAEYRRRYHRDPPLGFDKWWSYVKQNNVRLPDEYDQIYHDLEPFWGIEPKDLLQIQVELEAKKDSYTLGRNSSGGIDVVTWAFQEGRYNDLIRGSEKVLELVREVQELLPSFRATFSPHDGPNRLSDYDVKATVMTAAQERLYVERKDLPKVTSNGWVLACSPDSPARRRPLNLDIPPPLPIKKTFIHDHLATMDPCLHPDHFHHHGQFISHELGPTPQHAMVPEFSYCSTTIHHNIRIPVPYGWIEDIPRTDDPEWDFKLDERLLWRGSNTGMYHLDNNRWKNSHRNFLVDFTNDLNGTLKILSPTLNGDEKVGEPKDVKKAFVNPAMMDVAFVGNPLACVPSVCDQLKRIYPWRPYQAVKQAGNYKYVIDVDGNGWSGRFKRLITSNSLIFKSTIYPEWYTDRIAPWVHYVPIQIDLSDLHDVLMFFRGDSSGDGAHEELAQKIASAGRKWSKMYWRREDMIAYFFRLFLEHSRLMSLNREALSFKMR